MEVDGDATIVIPSGSIPSGTAHLKARPTRRLSFARQSLAESQPITSLTVRIHRGYSNGRPLRRFLRDFPTVRRGYDGAVVTPSSPQTAQRVGELQAAVNRCERRTAAPIRRIGRRLARCDFGPLD